MSRFSQAADHAMGVELQLEELNEQRERAAVQGQEGDVRRLNEEIVDLQGELAQTAEIAATEPPTPDPGPVLHDANELEVDTEPT
jgi:hypothetical protein